MVNRLGCVAVVLGTLGGSVVSFAPAHAQTHGFVGGTVGASVEPAGPAGDQFLDVGLGGSALSGGLTAGIATSPKVVLGFEATFARGFTEVQAATRLATRYERTHRDGIVSGVVRYRFSNRFSGIVGGSLVRSSTSEIRTETRFVVGPGGGVYVDETSFHDYVHISPGLVVGVDVIAVQWGRVTVAPSVRLHWFGQDEGDISTRLGLGYFVARPGVNVEVQF